MFANLQSNVISVLHSKEFWQGGMVSAVEQRWQKPAARGLHVARHSVLSGPRKHSEKSSNLKFVEKCEVTSVNWIACACKSVFAHEQL